MALASLNLDEDGENIDAVPTNNSADRYPGTSRLKRRESVSYTGPRTDHLFNLGDQLVWREAATGKISPGEVIKFALSSDGLIWKYKIKFDSQTIEPMWLKEAVLFDPNSETRPPAAPTKHDRRLSRRMSKVKLEKSKLVQNSDSDVTEQKLKKKKGRRGTRNESGSELNLSDSDASRPNSSH